MQNFKKLLIKKLKTCKYAIGLGNFAYTPTDFSLTSWISNDGKTVNATLTELVKTYADSWFKFELKQCVENGNFELILIKSNPAKQEWEEHFLRVVTK